MNRIDRYLDSRLPDPVGAFSGPEAVSLFCSYTRDPSNVPCPACGPGTIEVLAFIEPKIEEGAATITQPKGEYAAALYCHSCRRAIGVLVGPALL